MSVFKEIIRKATALEDRGKVTTVISESLS